MKSRLRIFLLLVCDGILINLAMIASVLLRFYGSNEVMNYLRFYLFIAPVITVTFLSIFYILRLYKRVWSYASLGELTAIVQAVSFGSLVAIVLCFFTSSLPFRSIAIIHWALTILLVGGSRLAWRMYIERMKVNGSKTSRRALIVGAGDAGAMVARELKNHSRTILPVGFIDDDPHKQNLSILGAPVLGNREQIPAIVKGQKIDLIIIAMPSVNASVIREIVEICRNAQAELKILPSMYQIINGQVSVNHLRPVQLEDLLRREPVQVDLKEMAGYLKDEAVLITGAGGSIGSELCRQVASFEPRKLILLDHAENGIHQICLELVDKFQVIPLEIEIADIRDKPRVDHIFQKHRPGVVFHAAAHKHVPLMEQHPAEAVKTNVVGTCHLAKAASQFGTKVFVMISTDKAVNPSSVMGATKRMAELIIQQENKTSKTIFTSVRFGNVLGSNGSVVPIFQQQIASGGPITVTHPEMKRYFMTIPEAVQLVIQVGAMAKGDEVFVLDMGEPVKIVDLARDMITLSGLEPEKDIKIIYTGIRPGEKLFEELLTAEEGTRATRHKRIFTAKPSLTEISIMESEITKLLQKGLQCTAEDIFSSLSDIVPSFKRYRQEQAM